MRFEKVSYNEFKRTVGVLPVEYDEIKIPKRATRNSAGYDFYSPIDFTLGPGETIVLPTFIKASVDCDKTLIMAPRSGQGFKYKVQLYNTIGVIDADYYSNEKNDGHIFVKLYNDSPDCKTMEVRKGDAICQGLIIQYFTVEDDDTTADRVGGFGSTDN